MGRLIKSHQRYGLIMDPLTHSPTVAKTFFYPMQVRNAVVLGHFAETGTERFKTVAKGKLRRMVNEVLCGLVGSPPTRSNADVRFRAHGKTLSLTVRSIYACYGGRHQKSWTCQDKGPGRAECLAYFQISWIASLFFILMSISALYNSDVVYIYEVYIYEV